MDSRLAIFYFGNLLKSGYLTVGEHKIPSTNSIRFRFIKFKKKVFRH